MNVQYAALLVEQRAHVAMLTLNRPDKLNALNDTLRAEFRQALAACGDNDEIRAVVITGAGRGFCSGADLTGKRASDATPGQNERLDPYGWVGRQALAIYRLDKPVIAAVNGVAAGAGMSMAVSCDLRVGTAKTRFKSVFIERNLSPDSGLSFFLPRIVGYSRAADLIYTSRFVSSEEAYRIGLLDRIFDEASLVDDAVALANDMTQWPPLALRMSKRVLQHNLQVDLEDALREEYHSLSMARKAENDTQESRLAFLEKRKPTYTGT